MKNAPKKGSKKNEGFEVSRFSSENGAPRRSNRHWAKAELQNWPYQDDEDDFLFGKAPDFFPEITQEQE